MKKDDYEDKPLDNPLAERAYFKCASRETRTHSGYTCCQINVQLKYFDCCFKSMKKGRRGVRLHAVVSQMAGKSM